MARISEQQIRVRAFAVLDDALIRAGASTLCEDRGVRLALAVLASRDIGERWPYDSFWQALSFDHHETRTANLTAALNAIRLRFPGCGA